MLNVNVRVIGKEIVEAKLVAAAPRILALNLEMVKAMLTWVKVETVAATPLGPGHFGYHLRDRFTESTGVRGIHAFGELKSPATGYWREFGTLAHSRRHGGVHISAKEARMVVAFMGFSGQRLGEGNGERAFMTAHRALAGARRIIRAFYSGKALWWRV